VPAEEDLFQIGPLVTEPMDEEEPAHANGATPLAMVPDDEPFPSARPSDRRAADNYPFLEVPRSDRRPAYREVRADAGIRPQRVDGPGPAGAEEPQRDAWCRRPFRRTN